MATSTLGGVQTPRPLANIVVQLAFRHYLKQIGPKSPNFDTTRKIPFFSKLGSKMEDHLRMAKILDLGMGKGSFLLSAGAILERMFTTKLRNPKHDLAKIRKDILIRNLWGVDGNKERVNDCRQNLTAWIGSDIGEVAAHLMEKTKIGNVLIGRTAAKTDNISHSFGQIDSDYPASFHWDEEFPTVFNQKNPGFDIIICNPPYVTKKLSPESIRVYRSLYGQMLFNRFNLYHLFFARMKDLMNPQGIAVFLTANSVLTDKYSLNLRKFLKESFEILGLVDFVSRNLFPKILQGVCIIALGFKDGQKRSSSPPLTQVFQTFDANTFHTGKFKCGAIREPHLFFQGKIIPSPDKNSFRILRYLQKTCVPARKLFKIQSGEIRPADPKIRPFYFRGFPQDCKPFAFDPVLNGKNVGPFLVNLSKSRPKSRWFQPPLVKGENPIFRSQHAFMERIVFQRITAREQLRRLVAAMIDRDHLSRHPVWVENNLNYLLLPSHKEEFTAEFLLGIFNSILLNWYLHQINLTAAVPPSDIGLLPLPSRQNLDVSLISQIENTVIQITKQLKKVDSGQQRLGNLCPVCRGHNSIEQLRESLDRLVFQLYGLSLSDQTLVTSQMGELHTYFGHH
ncbi:MAG: Eco57I restriction-modification methylase domain-containing protein [Candidatus Heimdallarchaeota archaeon]